MRERLYSIDVRKEPIAAFESVHKELRSVLEGGAEGLNLDRVQDFFTELNLPKHEVFFVTDAALEKVDKVLTPIFGEKSFEPTIGGMFVTELDLVFVRRTGRENSPTDKLVSESLAVHELAHASSGYSKGKMKERRSFFKKTLKPDVPRAGFFIKDQKSGLARGSFFEEGFCELLRSKYVTRHADLGAFLDHLTPHDSTLNKFGDLEQRVHLSPAHPLFLPAKYWLPQEEMARPKYPHPSFAGFGIELLCKENPELLPLMVAARSDVTALQKLPEAVNSIAPGLYGPLSKLEYKPEAFLGGLIKIWKGLGKDIRELVPEFDSTKQDLEQGN